MSVAVRTGQAFRRRGLTLLELSLVLGVLAVLGALIVPQLTRRADEASELVTWSTLREVQRAINNGYYADMYETLPYPLDTGRAQHPQLAYLYVNPTHYVSGASIGDSSWSYDPIARRGWSGPYLNAPGIYQINVESNFAAQYGADGDPAPLDGWGRAIVLQQPVFEGALPSDSNRQLARLVSAGPDGVLDTPAAAVAPTAAQINDDLILYLMPAP